MLAVAALILAAIVVAAGVAGFLAVQKKRRQERERLMSLQLVELLGQGPGVRRQAIAEAPTARLRLLWDQSTREIRSVRLAVTLGWYADLRRDVLDELASRDPSGVEYWMRFAPGIDLAAYYDPKGSNR